MICSLISTRRLITLTFLGLFALVANPAAAETPDSKAAGSAKHDLFSYLPSDSSSLAVIDVDAVRNSPYFDKATDYLESQGQVQGLTKLLESDTKAIEDQSVERVAVGFPAADARTAPERSTAILSGTFSKSSMKTLFTSEVDGFSAVDVGDALVAYKKGDTVAVLLDDSHLLLVTGPSTYRDRALNTAKGKVKSFADGSQPTAILEHLDTSMGIWMVNASSSLPKAASEGIVELGLALGVRDDLEIQAVFRSNSDDAAKKLEGQLSKASSEHAKNPMVEMLGIGPLLSNLKQSRKGTIVVATTSMTSSEVDALIERLEQVIGQMKGGSGSSTLPIPQGSSGGASDSKTSGSDASDSSASEEDASGDDGADADFN